MPVQTCCEDGARLLQSCSNKVEKAVQDIMALVHKDPVLPTFSDNDTKEVRKRKKEELLQFETECQELYNSLKHRFLEALMTSVRSTLELLRKKLSVRLVQGTAADAHLCSELHTMS